MAYPGGGKMSAVDAIIAEAADLVALEQIAKLNTAHLAADDSALPSSLESRFRKLKSLPAAAPPPPPVKTLGRSVTAPHPTLPDPPRPRPGLGPSPPHEQQQPPAPTVQEGQPTTDEEEEAAEKKKRDGHSSPRQAVRTPGTGPAAHDYYDDDDLERVFGSGGRRGRATLRERNRGWSPSPSPPRQACCFGFSPRKQPPRRRTPPAAKGKKVHGSGEGEDVLGVDAGEWGDENGRMVTELKEQQRKLQKALEEQVKVSRETAKMARWVKQASARMTHTAAIDDLLSDCEDDEELK
ncbi:hypothetical protein U9M48_026262 [Paspalum notatum var. saurae]|uniref:Uncharacterized protein n=1 Tax=Paspalum notatum var. saurae TaxID=547442 RepID=A0AAQ3TS55_PASNO